MFVALAFRRSITAMNDPCVNNLKGDEYCCVALHDQLDEGAHELPQRNEGLYGVRSTSWANSILRVSMQA